MGTAGCGVPLGHVRIPLETSPPRAVDASLVTLEDARPVEARRTRSGDFVSCERWYGDAVFEPDPVTQLKRLLAQRLPDGASAHVRLVAFDAIETCASKDLSGVSSAVGVTTGVYMNPGGGPNSGRMQLQIEGAINGKPFSAIRWFSHEDIDRRQVALDRNPLYHERIGALLERCADQIVEVAFPPAPKPQ